MSTGHVFGLASRGTPPVAYRDDRACKDTPDPEVFFPERGDNAWLAKAICRPCPCRDECLAWALDTRQEFGIWGGLTPEERRQLRRRTA